jgi:hypothetical protein
MEKDVHTEHCCVLHGCKYMDEDCPVKTRKKKQSYTCEDCELDGITEIPDPDAQDYDVQEMYNERQMRDEIRRLRRIIRECDCYCHETGTVHDLQRKRSKQLTSALIQLATQVHKKSKNELFLLIEKALRGDWPK